MFVENKKMLGILAIVIVGTLFTGVFTAYAINSSEGSLTQEAVKDTVTKDMKKEKITYESDVPFYEWAYAKATSEQKAEIDKIIADTSIDLPGEWRRPILIVLGDLPNNIPRLSVEQAAILFDTKEVSDLANEFNKIAGAPDFIGGSGIGRHIYFLNDERSEAIILMLNDVYYIVNNVDGTQTRLPIGTQNIIADPTPSKEPQLKTQ